VLYLLRDLKAIPQKHITAYCQLNLIWECTNYELFVGHHTRKLIKNANFLLSTRWQYARQSIIW